jgi:hypothetical protein
VISITRQIGRSCPSEAALAGDLTLPVSSLRIEDFFLQILGLVPLWGLLRFEAQAVKLQPVRFSG